jgi:Zn-finger nucleic acid-binding protein
MDDMTCPKCSGAMQRRQLGDVVVARCSSCSGIFLERSELGLLSEAENDWHRGASAHTEPMPRITTEMTTPPRSRPRARSFLETLFLG